METCRSVLEKRCIRRTSQLKEVPGMHKHFRMISLAQHLRNHGYNAENDVHTRIPGVWKKLRSLYNLKALDERVGTDHGQLL